jgi:tRNA(Ile)-lysidine synthase
LKKSSVPNIHLTSFLSELSETKCYWLAYSGGLDSTVLLHALFKIRNKLNSEIIAAHVNHGLSKNSVNWEEHCRLNCIDLGIKYISINVDIPKIKGKSPEELARESRYKALSEIIGEGDTVLVAHHQDDQVETVLIQLLRGAGPEGLAGMPKIKSFSSGWLARPLLSFTRKQLLAYAKIYNLRWVDDESNIDTTFDRNYIRKNIIPLISERWPSASTTISRAARHQADIIKLVNEISNHDMKHVCVDEENIINIEEFNKLSDIRQRLVLRAWISKRNLPIPNADVTDKIITDLVNSKIDSEPCVNWNGAEVRRYRNYIYVMKPIIKHDTCSIYKWDISEPLELEVGTLKAKLTKGDGIKAKLIKNKRVEIRYRKGGEKIKPVGRLRNCELKKLLQESEIPPWNRDCIPLLYIDNKLAEVAGYWIEDAFHAKANEDGWLISFTRTS